MEFAGFGICIPDEYAQAMWPDVPFDRTPAQSFVKSRPPRPRAQIGAGHVQREAIQRCAVDQRAADAAPARMLLHPHRRDPWRELRTLREIGGNYRGGAKKRLAVVGNQRERYRRRVHVFPQAVRNIVERMAAVPPPRLPDPVGNSVEKFRALSQVGNGEGHSGFPVRTYPFALNAIARHGHPNAPLIERQPMTEQPLTKKT